MKPAWTFAQVSRRFYRPEQSHCAVGIVNLMVFALMGFPYDSAPTSFQVASSLQIRRSKLRHSH